MTIYNYHHLQALKAQSIWDLKAKHLLVIGFGESKFIRQPYLVGWSQFDDLL